MRADAQAGHSAGIQTRFRELDQLLKQELGVSLSPQTRALHDELLRDLARPTPNVDAEVKELIEARSQIRPPGNLAGRSSAVRMSWVATAGLAALATTLGLSTSTQSASAQPDRIAVLPFQAIDGVDSAIAEGMADEVLSDLSQHDGIQTIGRTSSWMFKDKAEDLRRVGDKLDVRYIVEGSLRRTGGALRLNVALVDTRDASTLWSRGFQSATGDLQKIEDAATAGIVQQLGLRTKNNDQHAHPQAYARYVRAKALIRDRNWEKAREARDLLLQAVKIDPGFAPAWAQLGGVLMFVGGKAPLSGSNEKTSNAQALAAARKAVELDPQSAEAHQMLGFTLGLETPAGRAHLRHALRLDPNNPQTVYWWSNAAGMAGNAALQERAARRALALDPLWKRPVDVVSRFAIHKGHQAEARELLERLRAADPEAAIEVEMTQSHERGDLSRVVEIGRTPGNIRKVQGTSGIMTLAFALGEMGYVREALLIAGLRRFDRLIYLRRVPDRQTILAETEELIGTSEEAWMLTPLLIELARTNRHRDIVALFDRRGSGINRLQQIDESNRIFRATLGGIIGRALSEVGRNREGTKLFQASDEANRVILANGNLSPQAMVEVAGGEAMLGRRNRALNLLERAVSRGWFAYDGLSYRLDEMPWFESLRGDPRFERLAQATNARRAKERRETEALGLI